MGVEKPQAWVLIPLLSPNNINVFEIHIPCLQMMVKNTLPSSLKLLEEAAHGLGFQPFYMDVARGRDSEAPSDPG